MALFLRFWKKYLQSVRKRNILWQIKKTAANRGEFVL